MSTIITIAKREFKAYFVSPIAYIYLITFLVITHGLFLRNFFLVNQAELRAFFALMPWIYLFFIPAVSMGKWAEEKKTGTIEILFTLPIRQKDIVLGKFLASLGLIATALLLTFPLPITLAFLGDVDWGPIIGGYLGLLFLGGAYLSIGLWVSSLTENQIIAFILGVVVCFTFFIVGEPLITTGLPITIVSFFQYLGLGSHFESIGRGVMDSRDILYYLSVIGCFLFFNLKSLEAKEWKKKERRIVLATLLIGVATLNLLSYRHCTRIDLTEQKIYTLATSTKAILKNLEDVVTLRLYFSKDLPPELLTLRRGIEDTLTEFKTYAKQQIQVEYHDPQENVVEEQKVQMMGIPPLEVNVIKKDKQEVAKIYLGMGIHFEGKQEVIPVIQSTQNLEYELASNIVKVTQKTKPNLGWWGKEKEENFALLQDYLSRRFAMQYITENNLAQLDPKEIPALLFVVPETLTEAQKQAFKNYLEKGGTAVLFVDRFTIGTGVGIRPVPKANPLDDFLKNYGVKVNADLVLDQSSAMATFTGGVIALHMPYPYWVQIRQEGFNAEEPFVSQLNSLVLPWTSSIEIEKPILPGVSVLPLFKTTTYAVKNEPVDPTRSLDPDTTREIFSQGSQRSYPLGVFIDKKWIVIGTSRLIQDNFLEKFQENIIFLENAIDIFTTGDLLVGIRSKGGGSKPIAITSEGLRQIIKITDIALSPLLLAGAGLWIYWRRKRGATQLKFDYGLC